MGSNSLEAPPPLFIYLFFFFQVNFQSLLTRSLLLQLQQLNLKIKPIGKR